MFFVVPSVPKYTCFLVELPVVRVGHDACNNRASSRICRSGDDDGAGNHACPTFMIIHSLANRPLDS